MAGLARSELAHSTDILFFAPIVLAALYATRRYLLVFTGAAAVLYSAAFSLASNAHYAEEGYPLMLEWGVRVFFLFTCAHLFNVYAKSRRENREKMQGIIFERDKHIRELQLFLQLTQTLAENVRLEVRLDKLLQLYLRFLHAESGSIMLLDGEGKKLRIAASRELDQKIVDNVERRLGQGISGFVAQTGEPVLLPEGVSDNRFKVTRSIKDAMCVPLKTRDEVLGVLTANNKRGKTFSKEDLAMFISIANHAATYIQTARLFEEVEKLSFSTIKALVQAIEAKDLYTRGHSVRVTELAVMLAKEIGLGDRDLRILQTAALLHDVGKIGISENILLKPEKLTDSEFQKIKQHPAIGAAILQPIAGLAESINIIYHHHERFDGAGYLEGLRAEEIPLSSRILAVCDSFEAMTSDRPYRKGLSFEEAMEEMRRVAGTQLDPKLVDGLIHVLDKKHVRDQIESGELTEEALMAELLPEDSMVSGIISQMSSDLRPA